MSENDLNLYRRFINILLSVVLTIIISSGSAIIYMQVEQGKMRRDIDYQKAEVQRKADRDALEPRLQNIETLLQELKADLKEERKLKLRNQ